MGGDRAPQAPITGALQALAETDPVHTIQLVGRRELIEPALDELLRTEFPQLEGAHARLSIVHAPDVIEMSDRPTVAIRSKPNSSMVVGLSLHASGEADAFVSAGNTGAQMTASVFLLKLHHGVTRPAIAALFPTARKPVVVLDAGANVDCSAEEIAAFARLGSVYAHDILGRPDPVVGLLSIGEEPEKGNAAVKEAHRLLDHADLHFQGNVEGRDILAGETARGHIDVVVCDGFVGNVLLKFYESVGPLLFALLRKAGVDRTLLEQGFRSFDYSETGGAPLLGVNGYSIICHGSSSPRAIKNAIRVAIRAVETRMNEHIGHRLDPATTEHA